MREVLAEMAFEDIPESLMPSPEEVETILEALMLGVLDDHLAEIAAIVKIRQDLIASVFDVVALDLLEPGDTVGFHENAKPKYLAGQQGTVIGRTRERCVVQLDEPIGRYSDGVVQARASYLMKIGPE